MPRAPSTLELEHTQCCYWSDHLSERIYSRIALVIDPYRDGNSRLKPLLQETISMMLKYWQDVEKVPSRGFSTAHAENAIFVLLTKSRI